MILIVGGSQDHNIHRLANAAAWRNHPYRLIYTDAAEPPKVSWKPGLSQIEINGETFEASGTSLFIRYDVFGSDPDLKKAAFYDTIESWAESCPQAGMLNKTHKSVSKPCALTWAVEAGFDVPETWITNDFNRLAEPASYIAKPVAGGAYTQQLGDMISAAAPPFIVQEKLNYPELRLFRAGKHFFAFEITSDSLDYRVNDNFSMRAVEPPASLLKAMSRLTDRMKLDYAAADLKTCPETGKLLFMEINSMPMFTGYDDVAEGRLSDAIVIALRHLEKTPIIANDRKNDTAGSPHF